MSGINIIYSKTKEGDSFFKKLQKRGNEANAEAEKIVTDIISDIRLRGDDALFEYTKKLDKFNATAENILVTETEIKRAYDEVSPELLEIIRLSKKRVADFHSKQRQNSWFSTCENGEMLGQLVRPLESAGVYVPGGKAAYPSSVMMNIVPAKVAGVSKIVMVSPCGEDGKIPSVTLVAANEAGADCIYKIGGAQAVAALAYGTQSIPKVNIIVGPGNIYVALAKKNVYGQVAIDSIAGPSEILIVADHTAMPDFVAADMLSQAEHDETASSILVTTSPALAKSVREQIEAQTKASPRRQIIESSLKNFGAIIVTDTLEEAIDISNDFAPEHLEICTADNNMVFNRIKNAGAIFIGNYSPEALGDYTAGTNHVLPTGGTAKFFSALGVDSFLKKSSVIQFEKDALFELNEQTIKFAEAEGLFAHAESIRIRFRGGLK